MLQHRRPYHPRGARVVPCLPLVKASAFRTSYGRGSKRYVLAGESRHSPRHHVSPLQGLRPVKPSPARAPQKSGNDLQSQIRRFDRSKLKKVTDEPVEGASLPTLSGMSQGKKLTLMEKVRAGRRWWAGRWRSLRPAACCDDANAARSTRWRGPGALG